MVSNVDTSTNVFSVTPSSDFLSGFTPLAYDIPQVECLTLKAVGEGTFVPQGGKF